MDLLLRLRSRRRLLLHEDLLTLLQLNQKLLLIARWSLRRRRSSDLGRCAWAWKLHLRRPLRVHRVLRRALRRRTALEGAEIVWVHDDNAAGRRRDRGINQTCSQSEAVLLAVIVNGRQPAAPSDVLPSTVSEVSDWFSISSFRNFESDSRHSSSMFAGSAVVLRLLTILY